MHKSQEQANLRILTAGSLTYSILLTGVLGYFFTGINPASDSNINTINIEVHCNGSAKQQ